MLDEFGVVGVSWRQEDMEGLARYALPKRGRADRLKNFAERAGLDELAYLETCNRVELVFSQPAGIGSRDLRPLAFEFLRGRAPLPGEAARRLKAWRGEGAYEHLLLVTAGLDSAALGETEIAGQVRACRETAAEMGLLRLRLRLFFDEALQVAARIRSDTGLGRGRVSLAQVAVSRIREQLGSPPAPVALIGVSAITLRVARSLAGHGIPLTFVNRTLRRARQAAAEFGAGSRSLADFRRDPPAVGAILAATSAGRPVLRGAVLARIAAVPPARRPLLVDMGVPANIAPAPCERVGLRRVGMDEIVRVAQRNREARQAEAARARQLVDEALPAVRERLAERVYAPVYRALQERYREIAQQGVDRLLRKELRVLGTAEREQVSTWAEALARRLAHIPTRGLRGLLRHGPDGSMDAFIEGIGSDLGQRPHRVGGLGRLAAQAPHGKSS